MSARQKTPGRTGAGFAMGCGIFLCLLTTAASNASAQSNLRESLIGIDALPQHAQPGQIPQSGDPAKSTMPQAGAAQQSSTQPSAGAPLTLEQARQLALTNHPQLRAAQFSAAAAHQRVIEQRAAYFPTIAGDLTGVKSDDGRIAAGSLNNPVIFSRFAGGVGVQQLATDFGRTKNLVMSARLAENAENANVDASRADVLLTVDRAYYAALRAQAVLGVAQQTVNDRDVVAQQIHALFQSKLKSGLDVSFADVNLAQAKMLLAQAQNDADAATADLTRALGFADSRTYKLAEPPAAAELPDLNGALAEADQDRPDLIAQRYQVQSSQRFATAERDLFFPTLSIAGAAGEVPFGETQLPQNYGAIGFDVHVPIFNGRLFNARHSEAEDRARQAAEELRNEEIGVAHDVRVTWLAANTAQQNLALSAQLLDAANKALDLAQERYKLGLGSIVELSQAQLNQAQASIAQATAKYDYATRLAELSYQEGALK
jgi:outer membrane protein